VASKFGALKYGMRAKLFYCSLLEVSPRIFQITLALSQLITSLLAIMHQQENFHGRTFAGGFVSLAGVGIVFNNGINEICPNQTL
jgi:drug/metabolite transporter (DMT)-like permease